MTIPVEIRHSLDSESFDSCFFSKRASAFVLFFWSFVGLRFPIHHTYVQLVLLSFRRACKVMSLRLDFSQRLNRGRRAEQIKSRISHTHHTLRNRQTTTKNEEQHTTESDKKLVSGRLILKKQGQGNSLAPQQRPCCFCPQRNSRGYCNSFTVLFAV